MNKNIKSIIAELEKMNCNMSVGFDSWCYNFGNGYCITSDIKEYESDKDFYSLLLLDYDTIEDKVTIFEDNIVYIKKILEILKLKETAEKLKEINYTLKSTKIEKLLTLALNKACSIGELRNSVTISINIFNSLGIEI